MDSIPDICLDLYGLIAHDLFVMVFLIGAPLLLTWLCCDDDPRKGTEDAGFIEKAAGTNSDW